MMAVTSATHGGQTASGFPINEHNRDQFVAKFAEKILEKCREIDKSEKQKVIKVSFLVGIWESKYVSKKKNRAFAVPFEDAFKEITNSPVPFYTDLTKDQKKILNTVCDATAEKLRTSFLGLNNPKRAYNYEYSVQTKKVITKTPCLKLSVEMKNVWNNVLNYL